MAPVNIYCPECEAPNDETRPTCSHCGHPLKPLSVGHNLSLDELYERQTMLSFKLQTTREINEGLQRLDNVTKDAVSKTLEKYRESIVGQHRLVSQQIREAIQGQTYADDTPQSRTPPR